MTNWGEFIDRTRRFLRQKFNNPVQKEFLGLVLGLVNDVSGLAKAGDEYCKNVEKSLNAIHYDIHLDTELKKINEHIQKYSLKYIPKFKAANACIGIAAFLLVANGVLAYYEYTPLEKLARNAKAALSNEQYILPQKPPEEPKHFRVFAENSQTPQVKNTQILPPPSPDFIFYSSGDLFATNITSEIEQLKKEIANLKTRGAGSLVANDFFLKSTSREIDNLKNELAEVKKISAIQPPQQAYFDSNGLLAVQGDISNLKKSLATLETRVANVGNSGQPVTDNRVSTIESYIISNVMNRDELGVPDNIETFSALFRSKPTTARTDRITLVADQEGTLDIVNFRDSGTNIFRIADGGAVTISATTTFSNTTTSFNGVSYGFPSANGSSGSALINSGGGGLSWGIPVSGGGWTDDGAIVRLTTVSDIVGIGTSSPSHVLTVEGSSAASTTIAINNSNGGDPMLNFRDNGTDRWYLGFDNSDSDKFRITPLAGAFSATSSGITIGVDGFVGIGTTSPTAALEIGDGTDSVEFSTVGDITFVDADGAASITGPDGGTFTVAAGASRALTLTGNLASTWSTSDSSNGNLTITAGGSGDLILTADTGTFVGIGDTSPDYTVEISNSGTGQDSNFAISDFDVGHGAIGAVSQGDVFFQVSAISSADGGSRIFGVSESVGTQALELVGLNFNANITDGTPAVKIVGTGSNGSGTVADLSDANDVVLQVANNDNAAAFTIMANDRVGISDVTPDFVLEVAGTFAVSATAAGDGNSFIVTSSGLVGIGTIAPSHLLTVSGTDSASTTLAINNQNSGDTMIAFQTASTTQWYIGVDDSDGDKLRMTPLQGAFSATSSGITVDVGGNVGIGTTAPTAALSVTGSQTISSDLTVTGDIAVNGGDITSAASSFNLLNEPTTLNIGSTAVTRTINIGTGTNADAINIGTGATNIDTITLGNTAVATTFTLSSGATTGNILTVNDEASDTTQFVIDNAGRVGINVSSPSHMLTVSSGDSASTTIAINNTNSGDSMISFRDSGTDRWYLGFDNSDSDKFRITPLAGAFSATSSGITIGVDGFVGIGTTNPTFALTVDGSVRMDLDSSSSTAHAVCHTEGGATTNDIRLVDCNATPSADYAEMYPTDGVVEIGDVLTLTKENILTTQGDRMVKLTKTTKPYQSSIIGIVSSATGDFNLVGHNIKSKDNPIPVALSGRVLTKVSAENGPIEVGDRLTSSSKPGVAMKATKEGSTLGIALDSYENKEEIGTIVVFINLTYHKNESALASQALNDLLGNDSSDESLGDNINDLSLNEDGQFSGVKDQFTASLLDDQMSLRTLVLDLIKEFEDGLKDKLVRVKELFTDRLTIEKHEDPKDDTIGEGTILAGATSTEVSAPVLGELDKIFVTPSSKTVSPLFIADRKTGDGFTVGLNAQAEEDVRFDWWIIGVQQMNAVNEESPVPVVVPIEPPLDTLSSDSSPSTEETQEEVILSLPQDAPGDSTSTEADATDTETAGQDAAQTDTPTEETPAPPVPINEPEPAGPTVTILANPLGFLNVRAESNTDAEIVGTAYPDETYEFLGEQYDWYQIGLEENVTGWIAAQYAVKN